MQITYNTFVWIIADDDYVTEEVTKLHLSSSASISNSTPGFNHQITILFVALMFVKIHFIILKFSLLSSLFP